MRRNWVSIALLAALTCLGADSTLGQVVTQGNVSGPSSSMAGGATCFADGSGRKIADCSPGSAPTLSACGTSPSIAAGSTDAFGTFTAGGGTVLTCTLNFSVPFATTPACFFVRQKSGPGGTYLVAYAQPEAASASSVVASFTNTTDGTDQGCNGCTFFYTCTGRR